MDRKRWLILVLLAAALLLAGCTSKAEKEAVRGKRIHAQRVRI